MHASAGALSSFLMPSVFGKPIGKGSGINLSPVNSGSGIPAIPCRPEIQATLPSPTSLAQTKLSRYRSGTSPLIAAGPARPMQWGLSNGVVAEKPRQSFELPVLTKGSLGPSRGVLGSGLGRAQTQTPQPVQYTPSSGVTGPGSRRLFGR